MLNWHSLAFDAMNLVVILAVAGFLIRDAHRISRHQRRKIFNKPRKIGVGAG